jgi:low affinity Fe/Cu permease
MVTAIEDRSRSATERQAHMPDDVDGKIGGFDRFAQWCSDLFSKAGFFAFCVALVVVWAPSYFLLGSVDTWQLIINTATTIVTFLMVALLQNSQTRSDKAIQGKLNAIADALADFMESQTTDKNDLHRDTKELREAVGLEEVESS